MRRIIAIVAVAAFLLSAGFVKAEEKAAETKAPAAKVAPAGETKEKAAKPAKAKKAKKAKKAEEAK